MKSNKKYLTYAGNYFAFNYNVNVCARKVFNYVGLISDVNFSASLHISE